MVAAARGQCDRVAMIAGMCETARREIALGPEEPEDAMFARAVEAARAALGHERLDEQVEQGRREDLAAAGGTALALASSRPYRCHRADVSSVVGANDAKPSLIDPAGNDDHEVVDEQRSRDMFGIEVTPRRLAIAVAAIGLAVAQPAFAANGGNGNGNGNGPLPEKVVGADELKKAKETPIEEIVKNAKAFIQEDHGNGKGNGPKDGPDGPELSFDGAEPALAKASATSTLAAVAQNGAWTGAYSANPNKQIGKLYFWTGTRWSHCTATAINSENKSLVLTAGHCVFNPDPDGNGYVNGNGTWYSQVQFCPGYEFGCKLGTWYARNIYTTNSWFYGTGTLKSYDWSDDIAVVLVSSNPTKGLLVNAVGGQGITFNQSTGKYRYSFGYPLSDTRWPEYSYSGEDLMYCPGYDTYDGYGHLKLACTMTGGASGGPWIISQNTSWLGYVNSVNSHKAWGGPYMGGPYFGTAESDLFQYARNR